MKHDKYYHTEVHSYEHFSELICEQCGNDDLEDVTQCERCGEFIPPTADDEYLCESCLVELDMAIEEAAEKFRGKYMSYCEAKQYIHWRTDDDY